MAHFGLLASGKDSCSLGGGAGNRDVRAWNAPEKMKKLELSLMMFQ